MTTLSLSFQFLYCQLLYSVREMLFINHQYKILFNSLLIFVTCLFVLILGFDFSSFSSSFSCKEACLFESDLLNHQVMVY